MLSLFLLFLRYQETTMVLIWQPPGENYLARCQVSTLIDRPDVEIVLAWRQRPILVVALACAKFQMAIGPRAIKDAIQPET